MRKGSMPYGKPEVAVSVSFYEYENKFMMDWYVGFGSDQNFGDSYGDEELTEFGDPGYLPAGFRFELERLEESRVFWETARKINRNK